MSLLFSVHSCNCHLSTVFRYFFDDLMPLSQNVIEILWDVITFRKSIEYCCAFQRIGKYSDTKQRHSTHLYLLQDLAWYCARRSDGKIGMIPYNYVQEQGEVKALPMPWVDSTSHHRLPRWRHQMITFSALLAFCVGNSPVSGEFHAQRPVTRSFDVIFDLRLNKRLSKQ